MWRLGRDCFIAIVMDATIRHFLPTLVPLLPFAWVAILMWLTLDLLRARFLQKKVTYWKRRLSSWRPMVTYLVLFCIGGTVICLYWAIVTKVLSVAKSERADPSPKSAVVPSDIWQPLVEEERAAWERGLAEYKITSVTVSWGHETDGRLFYRSVQSIGSRLGWSVSTNPNRSSSKTIEIVVATDDPAGPEILKLVQRYHPARLITGSTFGPGYITILLPERPLP